MEQLSGAVREISIREDFRAELMRAVNETLRKMKRAVRDDIERFKLALVVLDGVNVRYEIIKPLRILSEMKKDLNWRRE